MSSLLKMNQKFLSKSSWTIRGNSSNNSNSNPNTPGRPQPPQNSKFIFGQNRQQKVFANGDKAQSGDNRQQQQQQQVRPQRRQYTSSNQQQSYSEQSSNRVQYRYSHHSNDQQQPQQSSTHQQLSTNGGVSRSNDGTADNDQYLDSSTPLKGGNHRVHRFHTNHHTGLVNIDFDHSIHSPSSSSGQNFGLRRAKGMSHSITDLRELKEKPPQKRGVYADQDDDEGFQREIFERRIDTYIAEIEMDPLFHLGSTIRAIYDGDEQDRFMEKLDARIKNHDKDIERMCNCHYQGFVDCIHELLKVRPQAVSLKNEIKQVNQELKNSSENIIRKAEELIKYRRVLCNTKIAIEHLQECLPVLETFSRLMNQMTEKKYYPALKTLDQFETLYLPKFSKYRFAQSMCSQVPKIRETIKNESVKDLKDFLENIRQSTSKIGEIALKNTALSHQTTDYVKTLLEFDKIWFDKAQSDDQQSSEDFGLNSDELSPSDIVDFSPVYRCLHIFGCLGSRDQFEHYYRLQRRQQAKLIFQFNSSNSSLFTGDGFRNYLFSVVGFFVIEDHLLNTSSGLVTKQYLAENWDEVIKALVKNVQEHAADCKDSKQMIYLKSLLMVFCHTVHSYGYCTDDIIKLLGDLRQIYIDILQADWTEKFENIFNSDNYHPLVIDNEDEYFEYFNSFPLNEMQSLKSYHSNDLNHMVEFPRKYPFSSMVINIYKAVQEFIVEAIQFSNDLNVTLNDTEDMVRSSTNLLLTKTLSDSLQTLIKKSKLSLLQLIQMSINLNYLEEASTYLKTHISEQITLSLHNDNDRSQTKVDIVHNNNNNNINNTNNTNHLTNNSNNNTAGDNSILQNAAGKNSKFINSNITNEPLSNTYLTELKGETMFAEARSDAESQIYTQLHCKVEEFFELANYDFMMTELTGKASPYILDLIAFLRSTFEAFTNLPPRVAQTACLSSSKFISSKMIDILKDENVKAFSQAFLDQFNLDLVQCEMYARSEPVPNFNDGALAECFFELRQVMDLLTVDANWSTYFADHGKNESRYLRVPPHLALSLLEKQIRGEQKKGVFSGLSKNERDKKNRNDMIVKKLKDLIANNNSANQ